MIEVVQLDYINSFDAVKTGTIANQWAVKNCPSYKGWNMTYYTFSHSASCHFHFERSDDTFLFKLRWL